MEDIQFVIPVKDGENFIAQTLMDLCAFCAIHRGCSIIVVDKQSTDGTRAVLEQFITARPDEPITVVFVEQSGIGHAYRSGILTALTRKETGRILLSAAELPFGLSDAEAFLALEKLPDVAVGSKSHAKSIVHRSLKDTVVNWIFRLIRRIFLGMKTRDPQGTIFLSLAAASKLVGRVNSADYFFTTELVFHAEQLGMQVVELPVVVSKNHQPWAMDIFRDGIRFLRQVRRLVLTPVGR